MKKFIARHIALPLQDAYNRTSVLKTFRFLQESQFWTEDQMYEYQFGKVKQLIEHAYYNVPYYQQLFSAIKLKPSDIRKLEDLSKIPILTKETARTQNKNLIARNRSMRHVIRGFTGGTTGPPLELLRDASDLSFTWGAYYRWYHWMGLDIGDPVTKIWGTRTVLSRTARRKIADTLKNFYYNRSLVNSFNLNKETLHDAVNCLNRFQPKLIRGYLSALLQLAEFMKENKLKLSFYPRAVSSTTETVLEPFRQLIQEQFGTTLYDQYGCGECNSMAFEAGDGLGLYVASEHVLIEYLDEDNAQVINRTGRIILTNLDNYIMPFIRYENGDSAIPITPVAERKYNLPLIQRISGRTADTIILANGSKVHGVFFTDILHELFGSNRDDIHRFQVFQDQAGEIEFRIESKESPGKDYLLKIRDTLTRYFTRVNVVYIPRLATDPSGKFRYVISTVKTH